MTESDERTREALPVGRRAQRRQAVLDKIADAAITFIQRHGIDALTFAAVAAEADLPERTLYRHATNRARLLEIVWSRLNQHLGMPHIPGTPHGLRDLPQETFAGFDRFEALIRATLHTEAGRDFRLQGAAERSRSFVAALAPLSHGMPDGDVKALAAGMQLLNSAAAWEFLRDYHAMDGRTAGTTASRIMHWLLQGIEAERQGK